MPKAGSKSGHRGTFRGWQGGGKFAKWGFLTVLLVRTLDVYDTQRLLGCRWAVLFLLAPTGLADTTDDAGGGQEQQG